MIWKRFSSWRTISLFLASTATALYVGKGSRITRSAGRSSATEGRAFPAEAEPPVVCSGNKAASRVWLLALLSQGVGGLAGTHWHISPSASISGNGSTETNWGYPVGRNGALGEEVLRLSCPPLRGACLASPVHNTPAPPPT